MIHVWTGFGWQPFARMVQHYRRMARAGQSDGSSAYPFYRARLHDLVTQIRNGDASVIEDARHAA